MNNNHSNKGSVWNGVCRIAPGLRSLSGYRRAWLNRDIVAGVSVAAIALPTGIAYSELAGVPVVYGMYSAIFPLLAYAIFGSSRQLMTGPDAATCVLVAATLGPLAGGDPDKYLALMVILSLLTGLMYLAAGVFRLGFISNFLSHPILTGFLNGIALIILAGQLKKLFGYSGEADGFFPQLLEFVQMLDQTHLPTVILGLGLMAALVALQRWVPKLPNPLIVVVTGIIVVAVLSLEQTGVAVIGSVPAGLPSFHLPVASFAATTSLLDDAAGLALVSFTSGVLTAKSFARRNRYEIDANQELIAFGACNIASGLAQGFPVTGADSRTAVNNAMGGKTQLVGIVAAGTMLLILFFLTAPLEYLPTPALAAVIMVSAVGLFDYTALREMRIASRVEMVLAVGTTAGVLILGVLPGVLITVASSLLWLLVVTSRPNDSILGRVPGMKGFHSLADYPEATTIPGLVLYRFDANLVFYNADYFKSRVKAAIAASETPVKWVVIDAAPVNVVDLTALQMIDDLREELEDRGISMVAARVKRSALRFFRQRWTVARRKERRKYVFATLKSAIRAFHKR